MIIKTIDENQLNIILKEVKNDIKNMICPEFFLILSKNIIFSPILTSKIFNTKFTLVNNFENINLSRYWTDKLLYNINITNDDEIIKHIKNNNLSTNFINADIFITKNDFPYVIPNCSYNLFVIWNLGKEDIDLINIIQYLELGNRDWILWKNPLIFKSIKTIEHYHLLTRPKNLERKLKRLYILQRHGPREPIVMPPKFIKKYWDNINSDYRTSVKNAKLTNLGKLYCQFIGNLIYNNYSDDFDFSSINSNNILFGTSDFQRTIETSILTIDGLGLDKQTNFLNVLDFLSSETILNKEQKDLYNYKMKNPEIKWERDLEELNNKIFELTGVKIKSFNDYFELSSTMKCYEFHNYKMLDNDEDNDKLNELKTTIYNLSTFYYNYMNNPENANNTETTLIGKKMCESILKMFSTSKYKFALLTTHDNSLIAFVKYIIYGVFNSDIEFDGLKYDKNYFTDNIISKIKYIEFPDFNSNIIFELWEDKDLNKTIRIYYNSKMLFEFS